MRGKVGSARTYRICIHESIQTDPAGDRKGSEGDRREMEKRVQRMQKTQDGRRIEDAQFRASTMRDLNPPGRFQVRSDIGVTARAVRTARFALRFCLYLRERPGFRVAMKRIRDCVKAVQAHALFSRTIFFCKSIRSIVEHLLYRDIHVDLIGWTLHVQSYDTQKHPIWPAECLRLLLRTLEGRPGLGHFVRRLSRIAEFIVLLVSRIVDRAFGAVKPTNHFIRCCDADRKPPARHTDIPKYNKPPPSHPRKAVLTFGPGSQDNGAALEKGGRYPNSERGRHVHALPQPPASMRAHLRLENIDPFKQFSDYAQDSNMSSEASMSCFVQSVVDCLDMQRGKLAGVKTNGAVPDDPWELGDLTPMRLLCEKERVPFIPIGSFADIEPELIVFYRTQYKFNPPEPDAQRALAPGPLLYFGSGQAGPGFGLQRYPWAVQERRQMRFDLSGQCAQNVRAASRYARGGRHDSGAEVGVPVVIQPPFKTSLRDWMRIACLEAASTVLWKVTIWNLDGCAPNERICNWNPQRGYGQKMREP
ncbi:hypothetical protein DFH07DRAFT_766154 [Mycena maculata]|uniref:Uncharacterized protein n=1 Tax=Mycena maculata TaxID=230809 RepID=A0AAD7K495_9AGAR|nr:hypothetical protein DFH07DRAFT_766154 [Mycena maculata]